MQHLGGKCCGMTEVCRTAGRVSIVTVKRVMNEARPDVAMLRPWV